MVRCEDCCHFGHWSVWCPGEDPWEVECDIGGNPEDLENVDDCEFFSEKGQDNSGGF